MNTGICDCGRLRQISFQVATAVLEHRDVYKRQVYPDRAGVRWWTKAWFNNWEEGEASVEIEREQAIRFSHDNIEKDVWLEEFYPKQMEIYHNAIEQTKEQLLMNRIGRCV